MILWPKHRAQFLNQRLSKLVRQEKISFTYVQSPSARYLRYFSDELHGELAAYAPDPFVFAPSVAEENATGVDVVIHMASGLEDDAPRLWNARGGDAGNSLILLWLWDNHVAGGDNVQASLAADVVFASHAYISSYLRTPAALLAPSVPACSAQWTRLEAESFFKKNFAKTRYHKLLFNYVDYGRGYPERKRVLDELTVKLVPMDHLSMTQEDRSRYFSQTREERFLEWMCYKATVIVPVAYDLSTRVFDALLTGMIPIIPENVFDADTVIPRAIQNQLGIVRVPNLELATVQAATYEALDRFDRMGQEGVMARHRYALENHMIVNRVTSMLEIIWRIGSGEFSVEFGQQDNTYALFLRRNDQ